VQYAVCGQKVGRQNALRAVPLLKVGRLEPSHWDTFRRHWQFVSTSLTYYNCLLGNIHLSHSLVTLEPPVDHISLLTACTFLSHRLYTPPISQSGQIQMLKSVRVVHFFKFGNHLSSPFLYFLEFVNVSFYTVDRMNPLFRSMRSRDCHTLMHDVVRFVTGRETRTWLSQTDRTLAAHTIGPYFNDI